MKKILLIALLFLSSCQFKTDYVLMVDYAGEYLIIVQNQLPDGESLVIICWEGFGRWVFSDWFYSIGDLYIKAAKLVSTEIPDYGELKIRLFECKFACKEVACAVISFGETETEIRY